MKGLNARIDFCKRLETNYGKSRRPDSERPLVKTDGSRPSDTTVMYDKGGWVFWMLMNHMGRDRALDGIQAFFKTYHGNPDHPVLQDFVEAMRPFAPDPAAYDAFTRQWFFEVVLPEYRLHEPRKSAAGETAGRRPSGSRTSARGRCPSRSPPCAAVVSTRRDRPRPTTARPGPP